MQYIPWDSLLRELRADAYLGVGNTVHAISDMRALTKLTNDNTDGFFKLSSLHYQVSTGHPIVCVCVVVVGVGVDRWYEKF
jgi:hypothetical protein